jgi:hypothetical protein
LLAGSFRNFAILQLRAHKHQESLWASQVLQEPWAVRKDLNRIEAQLAWSAASPEHLLAIRALSHGGSLRAAARDLGLTRWETRKRIADALIHLENKPPRALFEGPRPPKRPD